MFKESYNVVVKGITEIACDELGEFAGEGITKLIFNSNSKPEENYKEIVYEESLENNFLTYTRNIFSIPYINDKLEKLEDEKYLEVKGNDYYKYASSIIPPEELLTKHNHIFNPLGNLILAELSSAYLKPILLSNRFNPYVHFFKQFKFEWTYTDKYDVKIDNTEINTFLVDDKYVLFNNLDCKGESNSTYEFYIAIQKIGDPVIKIYKNPIYIYLEKYSDFKAAFWIKNVEDISSCFHFNNIHNKFQYIHILDWDFIDRYVYAYKKINLAEYNISNIDIEFSNFITFTSAESIIMPFYSNDDYCIIDRFICNNYRLKYIDWNEFSIKSTYINEFITYSSLKGMNLDLKFLKNAESVFNLFQYDDLSNTNISNFDTSQITLFYGIFYHTMGYNTLFDWKTPKLISNNWFISNDDIVVLNISLMNKTSIKEMKNAFSDCPSLIYADISGNVKVENDCDFNELFKRSISLKQVNIIGWNFSTTKFTAGVECDNYAIFDDAVISSVKIKLDPVMYSKYSDKIKRFFNIYNNDQYILCMECSYQVIITKTLYPYPCC